MPLFSVGCAYVAAPAKFRFAKLSYVCYRNSIQPRSALDALDSIDK
jgi:hypothetical protein